ncbi:MAG: NADH-quinone oxidoreductase subunit NuoG [Planctomycetaceae bacterium]
MATIHIDGKDYEVPDGRNLLEVSLSQGFDLPYFCWHPALGSVGACRQCAVKQFKDESDTRGRLVMACMTPAADGTRISIDDEEAREFRASVVEWLMANHPHDCPVCDEGGECHLQDMTVMTGHTLRDCRFDKRTHRNQYLGPFINHEMNRCIQCYRCVRFYRDYAGGRDFDVFAAHDHVYFGRHEDGVLENDFSGNLVEVCPTGVFTDKTLKQHYTRSWDLQTAPSVCVHCAAGCNTIPGERYGQLRRIRNRYNGQVNGYFLCDRGRFGYEFVNSDRRLRRPLVRSQPDQTPAATDRDAALSRVGGLLATPQTIIGIGSPRASLEANFALRELVGDENFCPGFSARDHELNPLAVQLLRDGPARTPSLHDVECADAVFVVGEDVSNTAPRLALALRQSVRRQPLVQAEQLHIPEWNDAAVRELAQDQQGPLFIASPCTTRIDDIATDSLRGAPTEIARLGFAVAHAIDGDSPSVPGLPSDVAKLAERVATELCAARCPLIISGTGCGSREVLQAAANVARALRTKHGIGELTLVVPECNSMGVAMLGGISLQAACDAVRQGRARTLVILENDLYRRAETPAVDELFDRAEHTIVVDHLRTATTDRAEVVFPAGTFAEAEGTLVNFEGRAQRFFQVFVPDGDVQESWRWLRDIMQHAGCAEAAEWDNLDAVIAALASRVPELEAVTRCAPSADFRIQGQKVPRQPLRYSGRTAMHADVDVSEPKPPDDPDSPLAFSMEGSHAMPPAALLSHSWAPGWNSVQSLNKFQSEVGGPLEGGDPGVRLIEPPASAQGDYFAPPSASQAPDNGDRQAVPLHHIFGSEELSMLTAGIEERSPQAFVALNPADADEWNSADSKAVNVAVNGQTLRLPVRRTTDVPVGIVGLPVGLPDLPYVELPAACRLSNGGPHE